MLRVFFLEGLGELGLRFQRLSLRELTWALVEGFYSSYHKGDL